MFGKIRDSFRNVHDDCRYNDNGMNECEDEIDIKTDKCINECDNSMKNNHVDNNDDDEDGDQNSYNQRPKMKGNTSKTIIHKNRNLSVRFDQIISIRFLQVLKARGGRVE